MDETKKVMKAYNVVQPGPRVEVIYAHYMSMQDGVLCFYVDGKLTHVFNPNAIRRADEVGPASDQA